MRARTATDLGAIIRRHRRAAGLSQSGLADAAGVSRATLIAIEAGKDTAELAIVLRVLAALDLVLDVAPTPSGPIDLDELLGDG